MSEGLLDYNVGCQAVLERFSGRYIEYWGDQACMSASVRDESTEQRARTVVPANERIPIAIRERPADVLLRLLEGDVHVPVQAREQACLSGQRTLRRRRLGARTAVVDAGGEADDDAFSDDGLEEVGGRACRGRRWWWGGLCGGGRLAGIVHGGRWAEERTCGNRRARSIDGEEGLEDAGHGILTFKFHFHPPTNLPRTYFMKTTWTGGNQLFTWW